MRLKDKVALVAGTGQGISRGIALRFAQEGARMVIADLHDDADSQQTLKLSVKPAAKATCWLPTSANVDALRGLVAEAVRRAGRISKAHSSLRRRSSGICAIAAPGALVAAAAA